MSKKSIANIEVSECYLIELATPSEKNLGLLKVTRTPCGVAPSPVQFEMCGLATLRQCSGAMLSGDSMIGSMVGSMTGSAGSLESMAGQGIVCHGLIVSSSHRLMVSSSHSPTVA